MDAINYSTFRENMKDYCDKVCEGSDPYIITRKGDGSNVVLLSLDSYNALIKAQRNEAYLRKLNTSFDQLRSGRGVAHDIIEDEA